MKTFLTPVMGARPRVEACTWSVQHACNPSHHHIPSSGGKQQSK